MKKIMRLALFAMLILGVAAPAYAAEPTRVSGNDSKSEDKEKEEICKLIKDEIKAGEDTRKVVSWSLRKGHKLCYVVRCAIDAGGNLQDIVSGAMDSGSTSDVISICTPLVTDPPKGTKGTTIMSPSSFK